MTPLRTYVEECNSVTVTILNMCHAFWCNFFLYKFPAPNRMQLYSAHETCMHVTKIVRFD